MKLRESHEDVKLEEQQGLTKTLPPIAHLLTNGSTPSHFRDFSVGGHIHDMPTLRTSIERPDIDWGYVSRTLNGSNLLLGSSSMRIEVPLVDTESTAWEVNPQAVRIEVLE